MKPDFSGYVTKAGLKCSDGRTIMPDAFKHMDGMKVPLVWQHGHNEPTNILGHALLEARKDGVYGYGFFNDTPSAQNAKKLVQHDDIKALSIYANQLVERTKNVFHGIIREVSLVLSGANPGALIDNVAIAHSDGTTDVLDDEAIIYTGLELTHDDSDDDDDQNGSDDDLEHAEDKTVKDVYDSLTDEQKNVVHYMIGAALEAASENNLEQSDESDEDDLLHQEGTQDMNVFENGGSKEGSGHVLTHDAMRGIFEDAEKRGSLKEAVEDYALKHGIEDIGALFPEPKDVHGGAPAWVKRQTEWVSGVINGVRSTPFTRIKTRTADLTHEDARAKGYITGNMKKEQFFGLAQRTTGPQTIYKKQKLDRDDILDITDFDVVAWIKAEMRIMLEEEVARAILFGDGRPVEDPANPGQPNPDKIKDPSGESSGNGIRSILHDHAFYAHPVPVPVPLEDGADYEPLVEEIARARRFYKGTGTPTFYTTEEIKTEMLLSKDNDGRRRYRTDQELAQALRVSSVVAVEAMETLLEGEEAAEPDLLGIITNLSDYAVGTDRGGQLTWFDDFDIDYNQYKYLIEGRMSGALTLPKSALVLRRATAAAPRGGLSTVGHSLLNPPEPAE
jgi:HK97 family phage prohead protease